MDLKFLVEYEYFFGLFQVFSNYVKIYKFVIVKLEMKQLYQYVQCISIISIFCLVEIYIYTKVFLNYIYISGIS